MSCHCMTQLLLLVIFVVLSVLYGDENLHYNLDEAQALFEKFTSKYNRTYKDNEDKDIHYGYFKENLDIINQLNEKHYPDTSFIINRFADFSKAEIDQWLDDHT